MSDGKSLNLKTAIRFEQEATEITERRICAESRAPVRTLGELVLVEQTNPGCSFSVTSVPSCSRQLPDSGSSAHLPNAGQLLVQAFGGNGKGGHEFLGKDRDFELLDQPAEFLHGLASFRGTRGNGLKFIPGILVRSELTGTFLIFGWIQRGALDSRKQCLEVTRNVRQAIE